MKYHNETSREIPSTSVYRIDYSIDKEIIYNKFQEAWGHEYTQSVLNLVGEIYDEQV